MALERKSICNKLYLLQIGMRDETDLISGTARYPSGQVQLQQNFRHLSRCRAGFTDQDIHRDRLWREQGDGFDACFILDFPGVGGFGEQIELLPRLTDMIGRSGLVENGDDVIRRFA